MTPFQLSRDEALFLAGQLRRQLQTVENELVHTDVRKMQHELAVDLERLRDLYDRLNEAVARDSAEPASPGDARTAHAG